MMRRTLVSQSSRSTAANDDATDFGRWLTRDLRPKGSSNEPRSTERLRLPGSVTVPEPESEFSRWLLVDLRPRNGSLPPPDSFGPLTIEQELAPELAPVIAEETVGEPAEEFVAVAPPPIEAVLQEEDLAVLPSYGRRGRDRRPLALLLLALLCVVGGGVALWGRGSTRSSPAAAAAAEALPGAVAAMPEPAPVTPAAPEPEVPLPALAAPAGHRPRLPPVDAAAGALARARGTGPSVARFADLPPPTLSRLAKDETRDTNERDSKVRAAAQSSRKSPTKVR